MHWTPETACVIIFILKASNQGRRFLWDGGGDVTPTFCSRLGGTGGYIDAGGTRGYTKISTCYDISLRVNNDTACDSLPKTKHNNVSVLSPKVRILMTIFITFALQSYLCKQ